MTNQESVQNYKREAWKRIKKWLDEVAELPPNADEKTQRELLIKGKTLFGIDPAESK